MRQDNIQVPREKGTNRFGLDMGYFRAWINRELNRPLTHYKPSEFARVLARAARTADKEVLAEPEFNASHQAPGHGLPTGLYDSHGTEICIGDRLRKRIACDREFHGDWAEFEVRQHGTTPILAYIRSQTGEVLPAGSLTAPLSYEYSPKAFSLAQDVSALKPIHALTLQKRG